MFFANGPRILVNANDRINDANHNLREMRNTYLFMYLEMAIMPNCNGINDNSGDFICSYDIEEHCVTFENKKDVVVYQYNGGPQVLRRDISQDPLVLEADVGAKTITFATESELQIVNPYFYTDIDLDDDAADVFFEKDGLYEDMTFVGADDLRYYCEAAYGNNAQREYRYRLGMVRIKLEKVDNILKVTAHKTGDQSHPNAGYQALYRPKN